MVCTSVAYLIIWCITNYNTQIFQSYLNSNYIPRSFLSLIIYFTFVVPPMMSVSLQTISSAWFICCGVCFQINSTLTFLAKANSVPITSLYPFLCDVVAMQPNLLWYLRSERNLLQSNVPLCKLWASAKKNWCPSSIRMCTDRGAYPSQMSCAIHVTVSMTSIQMVHCWLIVCFSLKLSSLNAYYYAFD